MRHRENKINEKASIIRLGLRASWAVILNEVKNPRIL
jgi:hypothetical protein